jgi:hypothetical protein
MTGGGAGFRIPEGPRLLAPHLGSLAAPYVRARADVSQRLRHTRNSGGPQGVRDPAELLL